MELLFVIALLAIFATLSYVAWSHQLKKARDAQRKAELDTWMTALFGYYDDALCFPEESEMYCGSKALDPYISDVPCDPLSDSTHNYLYERQGCSTAYIYALLEVENDPIISKVGCGGGCGPDGSKEYNYLVTSGDVQSVIDTGTEPTCGTMTKYCFPLECSTCCPGVNYRCNAAGDRCSVDPSCT